MTIKLKWEVAEAPTGMYRSFHKRNWPSAYINGKPAAHIRCEDEYIPRNVKTGNHAPLTVWIADHRASSNPNGGTFKWRQLITTHATLQEAKAAAEHFLNANPQILER